MQINNAIIAQYAQPFCYQFPESVLHFDAIPRIWIRYPLPSAAAPTRGCFHHRSYTSFDFPLPLIRRKL